MADSPGLIEYKRLRFSALLPTRYLYTPTHLWICREEGELCRVGVTKFGSRLLGEMVDYGFDVAAGAQVQVGEVIGWLEGFKALSDLPCVVQGLFGEENPALKSDVTLVSRDPHGAGWLYAVTGTPGDTCLDVAGYMAVLDSAIDAHA